jgi:hypothetical protein
MIDNRSSSLQVDTRARTASTRTRSVIVLPTRTEVFVRTERDQSPTTQTSGVSFISTDHHKEHEMSLVDDIERGLAK